MEAPPPPGCNILGVGCAILAASAVAVSYGRDAALVRCEPKKHGTRRKIDGAFHANLPSIAYVSGGTDQDMVLSLGVKVVQWIYIPVDSQWPDVLAADSIVVRPFEPVADLRSTARLLDGRSFVRSSGQIADYYFETLEAAFRYDVAATFSARLAEHGPWDVVAGVRWGGSYLATTIALHARSPVLLVKPDAENGIETIPGLTGSALLVDDLVNTGRSAKSCERLLRRQEGVDRVAFAALFALGSANVGSCDCLIPPVPLHAL